MTERVEFVEQSSRAEMVDVDVAVVEQLRQTATTFMLPVSAGLGSSNLRRVLSQDVPTRAPKVGLPPIARPRCNTAPYSEVARAKK